MKKNEARESLRSETHTESEYVLQSMQTCQLSNNGSVLEEKYERLNDDNRKQNINGLLAVLFELQFEKTTNVSFDDAYTIYSGFIDLPENQEEKAMKLKFKEALLNRNTGLCVNIVTIPNTSSRYIILRPDNTNMAMAYHTLVTACVNSECDDKMDRDHLKAVIKSMSTEYDKQCLKFVLTRNM